MKREEYIKPEMQVILLKSNTQLLTMSSLDYYYNEEVTNVTDIL